MNSKLLFTLFTIWAIITIASCSRNEKISIRLIGTETNLFGPYNSMYSIGDQVDLEGIDTTGLYIKVVDNTLQAVSIRNNEKYELSNGIRIGSHKNEVISIMRIPKEENITIYKGDVPVWKIPAFIYNDLTLFIDEDDRVEHIDLGKTF